MSLHAATVETAFQAGLILGMASVLSVGPNNLMLMREGLIQGRSGLVASLVWASYVLLLALSYLVADSGDMIGPGLRNLLAWLGLAVLSWFALQALRTAFGARSVLHLPNAGRESCDHCVRRVLAVVWLNPLTYLELLLVPAAICGTFATPGARVQFLTAVLLMAALCSYGYAFGGGLLALVLRRQETLRVFDLLSGLLLSLLVMSLAANLVTTTP